jgi:hypothetical protein
VILRLLQSAQLPDSNVFSGDLTLKNTQEYLVNAAHYMESAKTNGQFVAESLLRRIKSEQSTLKAEKNSSVVTEYKKGLEMFLLDLPNLLGQIQWPIVPILLNQVTNILVGN